MIYRKEKNKKLILIIILITICFFLISVYLKKPQKISQPNNPIGLAYGVPPPDLPLTKGKEKGGGLVVLEINGQKYESPVAEQTSVYNFMTQLKNEGKINFKDKNYPGMGKFIEEINGIKNSREKNWIYYVNNKKAEIGISNYKLNLGDVVSWKYESSY